MSNKLPRYEHEEWNTFEVLKAYTENLANAYASYARSIEALRQAHDNHFRNTSVQSNEISYQAALLNHEASKVMIQEIKDAMKQSKLNEWLP